MRALSSLVPLAVTVVLVLGTVKPVAAVSSCIPDLTSCYYHAAAIDDWLSRWLSGIDCELAFTDCVVKELCK